MIGYALPDRPVPNFRCAACHGRCWGESVVIERLFPVVDLSVKMAGEHHAQCPDRAEVEYWDGTTWLRVLRDEERTNA